MRILAMVGLAHVAGTVHPIPQVDAAAAATTMRDLAADRHVVLVHRVTEFLQIGYHAIVKELDPVPVASRRRGMHAGRSESTS